MALSAQHAYQEIEDALRSIVPHGSVFEVRLLGSNRKRLDAGYFDSPTAAATALAGLEQHYQGIYFTPNPVAPDLLARSANRITSWASTTTSDPEVTRRYWLLVDVDPIRPKGISATDQEHEVAMTLARQIAGMLEFQYGWCEPMLNSSGNGAHLMYPIFEENTTEVRDVIAKFLKCLGARFNVPGVVEVDTTVFNAARIWRIPGTWARKGDSVQARPHRKACIIKPIRHLQRVSIEQIAKFVADHEYLLSGNTAAAPRQDTVKHTGEYPADERRYRTLNDHAMRRIPEWVLVFFPGAREYKEGYRVSSDELGRLFEEDLTIHPWPLGIKDFGVADQGDKTEGRRTPVSLIAEFVTDGDKDLAARKLADVLNAPISEFTEIPVTNSANLPGMQAPRARFDFGSIRTISELKRKEFKEPKYIIKNVLPTGNIMLAARPKMRKTWLALQLGIAVATGGKFLEWQCEQGDVLFLGLEDNDRRIRSRIHTLQMWNINPPELDNFRYWTGGMDLDARGRLYVSDPEEAAATYSTFPRGEAGVDALEQYLEKFPKTSLIVIDTFQHFRDASSERDIYARDYNAQMPITRLAARKEILIMPVHHEKKGLASQSSGDFLEDVNGSAGITGGSDGVISIKGRRGVQDENESRKLFISGRDVPHDFEVDMSFDAERGGWLPAARQDVKVAVRSLLQRHPYVNQVELKALLPNVPVARLTKVLLQMKFEGEIEQNRLGYSLARN